MYDVNNFRPSVQNEPHHNRVDLALQIPIQEERHFVEPMVGGVVVKRSIEEDNS